MNPNSEKVTAAQQAKHVEKVDKPEEKKVPAAKKKAGPEPIKPEKTDMEPGFHKGIGFVTESGILFPKGLKLKYGHISWKGNVVMPKCPQCKKEMSPAESLKGLCANDECKFSLVDELEQYELK